MNEREAAFLLTPLREGRQSSFHRLGNAILFLLTPLREGRHVLSVTYPDVDGISTHAPAGGATFGMVKAAWQNLVFLLTPLREGRP